MTAPSMDAMTSDLLTKLARTDNDAGVRQHAGMCNRTGNVMAVKPVIETDRGRECLDKGIR